MCNNNNDCKCIGNILKVISILQKKAEEREELEEGCDKRMLGANCCCECNTRPVQLFLCGQNGDDPLVMPTTRGPITKTTCFSNVFRVEKVDDCCATFRVLEEKKVKSLEEADSIDSCSNFIATKSFFTLDLKCVCIIKCLDDTFVNCI